MEKHPNPKVAYTVAVILVLAFAGGAYALGKSTRSGKAGTESVAVATATPTASSTPTASPVLSPSATATPVATAAPTADPYSGWKAYEDKTIGMAIKYPASLKTATSEFITGDTGSEFYLEAPATDGSVALIAYSPTTDFSAGRGGKAAEVTSVTYDGKGKCTYKRAPGTYAGTMACEEISGVNGAKSYFGKLMSFDTEYTVAFIPTKNAKYPVVGVELGEKSTLSEADLKKILQSLTIL